MQFCFGWFFEELQLVLVGSLVLYNYFISNREHISFVLELMKSEEHLSVSMTFKFLYQFLRMTALHIAHKHLIIGKSSWEQKNLLQIFLFQMDKTWKMVKEFEKIQKQKNYQLMGEKNNCIPIIILKKRSSFISAKLAKEILMMISLWLHSCGWVKVIQLHIEAFAHSLQTRFSSL